LWTEGSFLLNRRILLRNGHWTVHIANPNVVDNLFGLDPWTIRLIFNKWKELIAKLPLLDQYGLCVWPIQRSGKANAVAPSLASYNIYIIRFIFFIDFKNYFFVWIEVLATKWVQIRKKQMYCKGCTWAGTTWRRTDCAWA
jgi:hypothetical protein